MRQATVMDYSESEISIEVAGDTAIAAYRFEITMR